jgi:hypothetical protein
MIGRDPLARNRDARLAWTSSIAAGEDDEWRRARIGGKAGARRKSMRSSGLPETLRDQSLLVFVMPIVLCERSSRCKTPA